MPAKMDLTGFPVPQSPAVQQRVRPVRLPLDVHSVAGRFRPEVDLLAEVPHFCKAEIVEHVTAPHGVGLKRAMAPLRKRYFNCTCLKVSPKFFAAGPFRIQKCW